MPKSAKPYVIAIEEHYSDPAVTARGTGPVRAVATLESRLNDLGEVRLSEMDSAGIDLQVISHAPSHVPALVTAVNRVITPNPAA